MKIQSRVGWVTWRTHAHTHSTVISKTYLLKGSLSITFIRTFSTVTTHNTTVKNWYDSIEKVEFVHVHHEMKTYEGMEVELKMLLI